MIPPNRYYGYRTQKTLESPEIWYRANSVCGWVMVITGGLALAHNMLIRHDHADWSSQSQQFFMVISTAVLLLGGVGISALYVKRL